MPKSILVKTTPYMFERLLYIPKEFMALYLIKVLPQYIKVRNRHHVFYEMVI